MSAPLDSGQRVSATDTDPTAAAATISGLIGKRTYITDISASSDKAGALIAVKDGSTVIWQDIVGAGNYQHQFATPLTGSDGADVSVSIDGTASCYANIAGVQL